MYQDREFYTIVTATKEDRGLFQGPIVTLDVPLSGRVGLNGRQDIVVTAYTSNGTPYDVLFAGRRKAEAEPLMRRLAALRGKGAASPSNTEMVQIEGAWRTTFMPMPTGWEKRRRQFVAARWRMKSGNGAQAYGALPLT